MRTWMLLLSLILMLVAVPALVIGLNEQAEGIWIVGLGVLGIGSAIPPVLRYLPLPGDDEEEDDGDGNDENGGSGETT